MKPLNGILVLDFSQFLSGPSAALRLADLGARVIKIERPGTGDLSRKLSLKNLVVDGDSIVFHAINRNKESFTANLKDPYELNLVKQLIQRADVLIENFRPGVMEKIGLGYEEVQALNPRLVYGSVTGYGKEGPWKNKPGQDLLVQALSGMTWLNGNKDQPPVPFGLSVADMYAGAHLVQGILACLVRRAKTNEGGRVEVSLLESILDLQFEVLTTFLNDGGQLPERSAINNAHAYLGAPYGIFETKDHFIAIAMGSVIELGQILDCHELTTYSNPDSWFEKRDEIKGLLVEHLRTKTTKEWVERLESANYWCSEVLQWNQLIDHEGFKVLDMLQDISRFSENELITTRCPIRINNQLLKSSKWAPKLGEDTENIKLEFYLN
ncbi:CaiB/BaiF CoA-transferase family protein [Pullulanibacillus sp. KACC 23026]|uniref:CaiB/BaiF CoA transferase family protein n=1 Tax=Pullulanibacillus sp. KACC 23026 TaxID=3028315 RepID=UPI0023B00F9B|nr:CaiB/BaiF CoA-transferase family protein [Pullulanibacillus sp. KACC 23026]WEG11731.1 CaiB/BaiF CoA-transferase family protein [Pullulanibacillus sp. KACC 23026]